MALTAEPTRQTKTIDTVTSLLTPSDSLADEKTAADCEALDQIPAGEQRLEGPHDTGANL